MIIFLYNYLVIYTLSKDIIYIIIFSPLNNIGHHLLIVNKFILLLYIKNIPITLVNDSYKSSGLILVTI